MNSILLDNASKIVPDTGLLVNMVRQRVRQLLRGSRPLLLVKPGLSLADTALSEIAAGKLIAERVLAPVVEVKAAAIINFPGTKPAVKSA